MNSGAPEKLVKFGFFTDVHIRGKNPESRKDDYLKSVMGKLQYIIDYAINNELDALLCGGDLFNVANVSDGIKNDLMVMFSPLRDCNIPLYTIVGSHDYLDYNMNTLNRTSIKVLHNAGLLHILSEPIIYGGVELFPFSHSNMAVSEPESYAIKKRSTRSIQLIHEMILHKPAPFPHILIDSLPIDSMGDVILLGHYHAGFGQNYVIERNGHYIVSPGSLGRVERTERMPSLILIDFNETGIESIKQHFVPCERDVFKEGVITIQDEARAERVKKLLSSLELDYTFMLDDPKDTVRKIGSKLGKTEKTIEYVQGLIRNYENEGR
jgi:DNA repair protein SbcD/Mre11